MPDWDVEAAVKHLQDKALAKSAKQCGKYARQAVEAGGVTLARHNSAKDYGPSLEAVGFLELNFCPRAYAKGDVAVIDGFAGHVHGHMQMYDGTQWISDFKQRDFWPGAAYRTANPAYKVYRYRTLGAQPPSATGAGGWMSTPAFSALFGN